MSVGPARTRDVVPDPQPNVPQALGLKLYGIAMRGEAKLSDFVGCEALMVQGETRRPNLNDIAAGRRHAIACVQYAARHLARTCNQLLNEIERSTTAGPEEHAAALLRLNDLLAAALDRVAPPSAP